MQGIGNFATKLVAMAKSLEESEKLDRIEKIHANTFHLVKKIVKIGPVDTEIAFLILKKEKITEGKIYSPVGNLAERAKNRHHAHYSQLTVRLKGRRSRLQGYQVVCRRRSAGVQVHIPS